MKTSLSKNWLFSFSLLFVGFFCSAQCPTVDDTTQSFCDIESLLVSDLQANDEGAGIAWFNSITSTSPLPGNTSLVNGGIYYLDNAAGNCGNRIAVTVSILGPPIGLNFQGVCVEDPTEATLEDLEVFGNDINWYASSSSNTPLDLSTGLTDGTIYYADQANPETGCRTSRLSVLVNIGIVPIPVGESVQEFCIGVDLIPTVADLEASGNNLWYASIFSASPLDPSTPLQDGGFYYATIIDPPCESINRFEVQVILIEQTSAGTDGFLEICSDSTDTFDLFQSLGGSPEPGGIWTPVLSGGGSIFDPNNDLQGVYTYTVVNNNTECPDDSATVTVSFFNPPIAGFDGNVEACSGDIATINLFDSLGGTPDTGGTWSPALSSGSGIFDPSVDAEGTYTYTVRSTNSVCADASASVTVSILIPPSAGNDGTLSICADDTTTVNLFDSLGGTPDAGGTWSPALSSGSGIFDPSVDAEGTYTYTVRSTNSVCADASASVTVSILIPPSAGNDGTLSICADDTTTVNLFDSLGGTPDAGGTWSPALSSGSGIFDPSVDAEGTYTYTVSSANSVCADASATVTVSIINPPSAGNDGTLSICADDTSTVNLFDSLGGTPDAGGTWSPSLNSGSGIFNPSVDAEGTYTYTVSSTNSVCANASATVTVSILIPPSAGNDGTLSICADDTTTVNLFNSLGGTPDAGGTWSPALSSGSGIFNPSVDAEGTYTYTVSSTNSVCADASATVTVSILNPPSAGNDGALSICTDDTATVNLFDSLGGTPDTGGTWSPALSSGSGIFDPNIDTEGTYTYTVPASQCGSQDSAEVTITFVPSPDISNLFINIDNVCEGFDVSVTLEGMTSLQNGDYLIFYEISGSNSITDSVVANAVNGELTFVIIAELFESTGFNALNLLLFESADNGCSASLNPELSATFEILESISPQLTNEGSTFCIDEAPTLEDLTNRLIETTGIEWYETENSVIPLPISTILLNGVTYYASILNNNKCPSVNRLAVQVNLDDCIEELIIPDGFSPNGDAVNDTFRIVNLEILYPNFKLTIYNRYGNKLYEGNINTPRWDGTTTNSRVGGGIVPTGVYFYILEFNDGIKEAQQGRLYLSR